MRTHRPTFAVLASLASLAVACSSSSPNALDTTDESAFAGGVPTSDPLFNAVGRIYWRVGMFGEGYCEGVLVAPRVFLTAAHCVQNVDQDDSDHMILRDWHDGVRVQFNTPAVNGVATVSHTAYPDSILRFGAKKRQIDDMDGYGIDIALVMFKEPIPSSVAVPLPVRPTTLGQADVGKDLTIVGYDSYKGKARHLGQLRLEAVSGKIYPQIFDSRSAFDQYMSRLDNPDWDPNWSTDNADWIWNKEAYTYGREVYMYAATVADSKMAAWIGHGDSGSPVFEKIGNSYQVVGVTSAVMTDGNDRPILADYIVRLDDQVTDAINIRKNAVDPSALIQCPTDSTPNDKYDHHEDTRCDVNDTLVACRTLYSWRQRVERCADRGLHCVTKNGFADCL